MTGAAGPVIDARGIEKRYGAREVLCGVDLEVRGGEVFCLLGPNGAGKTTTVEILEGFGRVTAGTVRVLGFDPARRSPAFRERIGVVLQECGFPRHLRVAELLDAWRGYYTLPRPLDELLEVAELRAERSTLVRRLSGGQRRRLDFALALAGDPDVIFLDEPTTGFDIDARRRCWTVIGNLRALGKTIVLTTHQLDEAERLCDRVAILNGGRIAAAGTPRALARQARAPAHISFSAPPQLRNGQVALTDGLRLSVTGGRAEGTAADASAALRALLAWADGQGMAGLDDLTVTPPGLEQAYLTVVGLDGAEGR
jgi:ABC-2 type transport system ATP-binding protein